MELVNELDAGMTRYMYRKDGSIRFSQNAEQALSGKYSYTNYDRIGRPIESGAFDPTGTVLVFQTPDLKAVLENIGVDGGLTGGVKTERILTHYDEADPAAPITQDFTIGKIACTEKPGVSKTWYSYDERGRMKQTAQELTGLGIHKIDYRYNYSGNVWEVAYNRGQADQFYHVYEYDLDTRLSKVYTSTTSPQYDELFSGRVASE